MLTVAPNDLLRQTPMDRSITVFHVKQPGDTPSLAEMPLINLAVLFHVKHQHSTAQRRRNLEAERT
jgi:hypothetical protein